MIIDEIEEEETHAFEIKSISSIRCHQEKESESSLTIDQTLLNEDRWIRIHFLGVEDDGGCKL